jgi:hypothetical protein
LTLRISVLKNNDFEDVPYKENSFISEELYENLAYSPGDRGEPRESMKYIDMDFNKTDLQFTAVGFGKAYYFGTYERKFSAIDNNYKEIYYGSSSTLYVDFEFKDFRWVVTRVWEPV